MLKTLYGCLVATFLIAAACTPATEPDSATATPDATTSPHVGTWILNVAQSTYSPGPAPKSQTVTIEAWGEDGLSYVSNGVAADDQPTHLEFQAKFDGMDYEVKGSADADALSYQKVDDNTLDATLKLKGMPVSTAHIVLSADGRTRTVTQTGTNGQGQAMNIVSVYEKQ